jgi:hypothetical protein|tara:strand:+ start:2289 stop:2462 length:174 start_codon:yes stop_codon:yes gene_type:complete
MFKGFIDGLKKSFSGKDHLRNINKCSNCGDPSYSDLCLKCEVEDVYKKSQENGRDNV